MAAIHAIILKNSAIHGINSAMDRKNINRGFKKLCVWRLDQLHDKVENALLKLIESLQKKQAQKQWEDKLQPK